MTRCRECGVGGKDCGVHMKGLVSSSSDEAQLLEEDSRCSTAGLRLILLSPSTHGCCCSCWGGGTKLPLLEALVVGAEAVGAASGVEMAMVATNGRSDTL